LKSDILESSNPILLKKMREYLKAESKNQFETWIKEGILTRENNEVSIVGIDEKYKEKFGNNVKEILLNYVATNLIANMNYMQMFMGDPAFLYKAGGSNLLDSMNTFDAVGKRLS